MTTLSLLLILGASGTATRSIVVDDSIAGIVARVAMGGVRDVLGRRNRLQGVDDSVLLRSAKLTIDGEPASGICGWGMAAARTVGYATDLCDRGSVAYAYGLHLRGLDIRRETLISDDHVLLTTDVYGRIGPRGELYHVRVSIQANKTGNGSVQITGTATGWTHIGDRCRLVRRIAERQISAVLGRELLGAIQSGGTRLYHAGELHGITDRIIEGLRPR